MHLLKLARRAAASTVLYVAAASVGLLSHEVVVAIGLLVAAGGLHFLLGVRRYRREYLPKLVLLGLLKDQLEEFRRNLQDCDLEPCWTIWLPSGETQLVVCAADSGAEVFADAHGRQEADMSSAIWAAYHLKEPRFETSAPRAMAHASGTVQGVDTRDWVWRLAHPVFHLTDEFKVAAVVVVHGVGAVTGPEDFKCHDIPDFCARACHMARPIVSVLETYD